MEPKNFESSISKAYLLASLLGYSDENEFIDNFIGYFKLPNIDSKKVCFAYLYKYGVDILSNYHLGYKIIDALENIKIQIDNNSYYFKEFDISNDIQIVDFIQTVLWCLGKNYSIDELIDNLQSDEIYEYIVSIIHENPKITVSDELQNVDSLTNNVLNNISCFGNQQIYELVYSILSSFDKGVFSLSDWKIYFNSSDVINKISKISEFTETNNKYIISELKLGILMGLFDVESWGLNYGSNLDYILNQMETEIFNGL